MSHDTAVVIGAGAFGTSIASVLSFNFKKVILKVRSEDIYQDLKQHKNTVYLDGVELPDNLYGALTWEEVEELSGDNVEIVISGLPTSAISGFCKENHDVLENYLKLGIPFVSLAKGIHSENLKLPDELFFDYFHEYRDQFTFLSGPSFAKEILDKQITLVTLAGRSKPVMEKASKMLSASFFKVFQAYDVKGVLLGGALKNVIAIAGGIAEGLGFNHNTRAALITRAIREMLRFGYVYNARPETFYGLSGMGDLILTTTGGLSRNKQFGLEIAKGREPLEIINSQRSVVEGYKTAQSVHFLTENYDIRATIFNGVYGILYEGVSPEAAIEGLISMEPRFEIEI